MPVESGVDPELLDGHRLVYGLERGHYRDDDAVGSTLRGMLSRISRRHGAPS